jgi:hypothetical protein
MGRGTDSKALSLKQTTSRCSIRQILSRFFVPITKYLVRAAMATPLDPEHPHVTRPGPPKRLIVCCDGTWMDSLGEKRLVGFYRVKPTTAH